MLSALIFFSFKNYKKAQESFLRLSYASVIWFRFKGFFSALRNCKTPLAVTDGGKLKDK
jgi:hypothetical protein